MSKPKVDDDEALSVTLDEVRRAPAELIEMGLVVDSGRKRWNPRTGEMDTIYEAVNVAARKPCS